MIKHPITLALILAASLSACSMAPTYQRPAMPVPAQWSQQTAAGQAVSQLPWRDYFADPVLRKLIDTALENNRDLRVAALTVKKYEAQYRIQRAAQLPTVNATGSETATRTPAALSSTGQERVSHQYSAGVGISSYELDFFGRIQSLKDQALEQYLAMEESQRTTQITLVAQIASDYLTLAADREHLLLAQSTLKSYQETLSLMTRKAQAGSASALDVAQAQSGLESARADLARYTSLVEQDVDTLSMDVGSDVSKDLLPEKLPEQITTFADLPAGTPSDVLLARPDVIQAEHQLKAANANIGAARAAFFPKIALTASGGFGSLMLDDLFKGASRTWTFMPQISVPIFDGGSNSANLDVAKINRDIYVAQYEKAIQTAFREVSTALTEHGSLVEQESAQVSLTTAYADVDRLTRLRFDKGVENYLNVLTAQRNLYSAQHNLITIRQSRQANMVTLYKVLGGGGVLDSKSAS